jgi:6,7-dimethyl-8-ribityllumazine synthase
VDAAHKARQVGVVIESPGSVMVSTKINPHKARILVICSNYYPELAKQHLEHALKLLDSPEYQAKYEYSIEMLEAGTYEIPFVIQHCHRNRPFDAYLPLSLLLKGGTDHYEFIWEHVKECFIRFALEGIVIGNGIISAPTMEALTSRVEEGARVEEAVRAIDYLLKFKGTQI